MTRRKNKNIAAAFASLTLALLACLPLLSARPTFAGSLSDLARFPQRASAYLPENPDEPILPRENQKVYADEFLKNHYAPWQYEDLSYLALTEEKIVSLWKDTARRQFFTEGGSRFPRAEMTALLSNADVPFGSVNRPGIALAEADVRVLPTARALYPSEASAKGERGLLRLDSLQNSALKPGEPLRVLHASKDAAWAFVATGSVVGWVRASKAALIDADFADRWSYSDHAVFVRDDARIAGRDGISRTAKMGTVLPCDGETLYLPYRGETGLAAIEAFKPGQGFTERFPVPFTPRNAVRAVAQMMGEPYGWGGASGHRDCSAMTRDYFSLFGVWLPRNSADQASVGAAIPLRNIRPEERRRVILESAVPFATLIQMPGHIMLYLGVYDAEPVVFHNVWGVRVNMPGGKSGRAVVGRAAATSLYLGAEIADRPQGSLFIDNLAALSFPAAGAW